MPELILEIVEGPQSGHKLDLLSTPVEVGRDPGVQLSVEDDQVSRHHARVSPSGGGAVIEDLGSTNGTYVNDQPIQEARAMRPGDRFRVGLTVVELRSPEQVAAQPSAVRPVPQLTAVGQGVLQPASEQELPPVQQAAAGVPSFLVEETEPAFVPREVVGDADAESDYHAIASLVDSSVKRQRNIAAFAFLALAGLAVLIYFGVR